MSEIQMLETIVIEPMHFDVLRRMVEMKPKGKSIRTLTMGLGAGGSSTMTAVASSIWEWEASRPPFVGLMPNCEILG